MNSIIQIGNIRKGTLTFDNPQSGRIYSSNGICPTLNTCQGGGLEPKVMISKKGDKEVCLLTPNNFSHKAGDGMVTRKREIRYVHPALQANTGSTQTTYLMEKQSVTNGNERVDMSYKMQGNNYNQRQVVHDDKEVSRTLIGQGHSGNEPKVVVKMNTKKDEYKNVFIPKETVQYAIDHPNYAIRKLIPLECNRLMGFPDWVHRKQKEAGISDCQEYKQAGNSIVTAPLYYIFRNLHEEMPYLFDDLRVGSYFSGVGAFEMALNMLYSEINYGTPMVWFEHGGDTSDECTE